ncbi:MAG: M23 family metallopeptidase, partial [Anaerolineales bacterium]|nr:M23 family metallopeptidase [Anaerolineales bacterium]
HGDGTKTLYAHLNSVNVAAGQTVSQGELIGETGHTGNSTHPHLHFELYIAKQAVYPCLFLEGGCR